MVPASGRPRINRGLLRAMWNFRLFSKQKRLYPSLHHPSVAISSALPEHTTDFEAAEFPGPFFSSPRIRWKRPRRPCLARAPMARLVARHLRRNSRPVNRHAGGPCIPRCEATCWNPFGPLDSPSWNCCSSPCKYKRHWQCPAPSICRRKACAQKPVETAFARLPAKCATTVGARESKMPYRSPTTTASPRTRPATRCSSCWQSSCPTSMVRCSSRPTLVLLWGFS